MKQQLVRINSADKIEQVGILYTPDKATDKVVIHVHGLCGSFYENRFIDPLAESYVNNGYAFLTFNNRGHGFILEALQEHTFITIGGCLERFKDSFLDIEGVVNWVKEKNFKEIILEGHSYGCNKVLYYYHNKKEDCIKKLVLLAPCDIPTRMRKSLGEEEYNIAKKEATKLINDGKEDELINCHILANEKVSARTFYYDFLPNGENDFIKYWDDLNNRNEVLNSVGIPVLVIFGDKDRSVATQPIDKVTAYLKANIDNLGIHIIKEAGHLYKNKGKELGEIIQSNL